LKPWWTGSRLFPEVTVQVSEQATSQNLGSPAAFTSISSGGITPWGLYPNYYMSQNYAGVDKGKSNREIAEELVISERTVANHLASIFNKTGVENRAAAAAFAIRHELAE
jgi:hypothetical protein